MADLNDLEKKIDDFKSRKEKDSQSQEDSEFSSRQTGMRAGSEFTAYILSGGLIGWAMGYFFGNMAIWLIVMMFAGFGLGIYRASQIMK